MEIIVKELEECKLAVHCDASVIEVLDKKAEVLNAFKKAPVKGYRKDVAPPLDVIKMQYRKEIDESLKRAMAEECLHEAMFQKSLKPHGAPTFTSLMLEGGKFSCDFEMRVKPDFTLPDWKTWEVPKPHEDFTSDQIVEAMMQDLRVRVGDAVPFAPTDFVQSGDNIIVDYTGTIDGKKIDGLCVEGEMMTIGKSMLKGFDSNLLGMSIDETREFDFVAPTDSLPSMAGKTVHFVATLKTGSKTEPCPLNDELAERIGKKTLDEVRAAVGEAAFAQIANASRMKLQEAIGRRLVGETEVKVPNWMSLSESQYLAQQAHLDWNAASDPDKEKLLQVAEQNVKLSLILDKIREETVEAQLSDQEVFDIIKQNLMNSNVKKPMDEVFKELQKSGYLSILQSRIKDEFCMSYLIKSIKVVE